MHSDSWEPPYGTRSQREPMAGRASKTRKPALSATSKLAGRACRCSCAASPTVAYVSDQCRERECCPSCSTYTEVMPFLLIGAMLVACRQVAGAWWLPLRWPGQRPTTAWALLPPCRSLTGRYWASSESSCNSATTLSFLPSPCSGGLGPCEVRV